MACRPVLIGGLGRQSSTWKLTATLRAQFDAMRVLIIEDNDGISENLFDGLSFANMIPTIQKDGRHADMVLETAHRCQELFDAVVMDLTLPSMDGTKVLTRMRERGDATPVLILSGRSSTVERVECLNMGADDFLAKPYELTELIARIRAAARRHQGWSSHVATLGNLQFDSTSQTFSIEHQPLGLAPRSRLIMEALFRRQGHPVSKDFLANLTDPGSTYEAVDIQISRIRKRLNEMKASVNIRTLYGQGYVLVENSRAGER